MDRAVSVIRSTGRNALRLSQYPPAEEISRSTGTEAIRPSQKRFSTSRFPPAGAAEASTSLSWPKVNPCSSTQYGCPPESICLNNSGEPAGRTGQRNTFAAADGEGTAREPSGLKI